MFSKHWPNYRHVCAYSSHYYTAYCTLNQKSNSYSVYDCFGELGASPTRLLRLIFASFSWVFFVMCFAIYVIRFFSFQCFVSIWNVWWFCVFVSFRYWLILWYALYLISLSWCLKNLICVFGNPWHRPINQHQTYMNRD